MSTADVSRRIFMQGAGAATAAVVAAGPAAVAGAAAGRVKVAVIGCGSVCRHYFPSLRESPHAEVVAACDRLPERAAAAAEKYGVPHHCGSLDALLEGPAFDLLVNLTDMQEHRAINERAIDAGRHVWSEKPLATRHADARALLERAEAKGVRILAAPTVVASPQFQFMLRAVREGTLGSVAAGHASYGHLGPTWASFFYDRDGGSIFDLGVYSLATLTGLFGPARAVTALTSIVTPERTITGKGRVAVAAEDNAMVVMEHEGGVLAHVQCGFNYFTPREHSETDQAHHTLSVVGTRGSMHLAGYDWAPHAVDLATPASGRKLQRQAAEPHDYVWQCGAARMAAWLAGGERPPFTAEHAAHLVEVMEAAHESQATGRRIRLASTFPPVPLIGATP